ncbi:MAG TPA: hypothetical protein VNH65_11680 [Candidatus Acidoferrum sp.]|nr:hypothetical protein [Candidatus Acidoferrum sp.]
MTALAAVIANLILLVAAFGFGSLLGSLIPQSFSLLDRFAIKLLGGLGFLGTILFCIGQVWFSRFAIILVLLLGVLLALASSAKAARELRAAPIKSNLRALPALIVTIVLLITAVGGLAEPVGDIKMDEIAYHLLGPKVWLRNAIIRPVVDEAYTAFPAVVEVQYAALMSLGGQRAPGFFAVIGLFSILLIAASLALRSGLSSPGAWWTAALIITMPVLYRGTFGGFVDVIYSAFVLAALRVAFDARRPAHFVLFGLFAGFAMDTKYTGLIAAVLLVICLFLLAAFAQDLEKKIPLKHLRIASAAAIAVAAPWYLRNWLLLGCPIYPPPPILWRFFPVKYLSPEAILHFHASVLKAGAGMGRDPWSLLMLPFHFTFHPANFLNGAGGIGLVPLALGPFGLFSRRRDAFAPGLWFFALLQTVAWFFTEQEARFLIHVYVLAAIFGVWGWTYVVKTAPKLGPALSALAVACSILYGLFMIGSARLDDLHAVVSSAFEEKRMQQEIPFLASFSYLNKESSVSKVLVLEPRLPTYYLDKSYLKPIGRWGEHSLPEANNLDQILSELPRLQISHIMDVREEGGSFRLPQHSANLMLVFQSNNQRVFAVD